MHVLSLGFRSIIGRKITDDCPGNSPVCTVCMTPELNGSVRMELPLQFPFLLLGLQIVLFGACRTSGSAVHHSLAEKSFVNPGLLYHFFQTDVKFPANRCSVFYKWCDDRHYSHSMKCFETIKGCKGCSVIVYISHHELNKVSLQLEALLPD